MERGDVKCCLVMATNPAQSLPNADRYRRAMQKTFLVVADTFHPTETTQFADVVLPAALWAEKEGRLQPIGAPLSPGSEGGGAAGGGTQ